MPSLRRQRGKVTDKGCTKLACQGLCKADATICACTPEGGCRQDGEGLVEFYRELLSQCGRLGFHVCWRFVILDVQISAMQVYIVRVGNMVRSVAVLPGFAGLATRSKLLAAPSCWCPCCAFLVHVTWIRVDILSGAELNPVTHQLNLQGFCEFNAPVSLMYCVASPVRLRWGWEPCRWTIAARATEERAGVEVSAPCFCEAAVIARCKEEDRYWEWRRSAPDAWTV